jgi:hypothetical protein
MLRTVSRLRAMLVVVQRLLHIVPLLALIPMQARLAVALRHGKREIRLGMTGSRRATQPWMVSPSSSSIVLGNCWHAAAMNVAALSSPIDLSRRAQGV